MGTPAKIRGGLQKEASEPLFLQLLLAEVTLQRGLESAKHGFKETIGLFFAGCWTPLLSCQAGTPKNCNSALL